MTEVAHWGTQGGGTAIWDGQSYVFIAAPEWWPDAVGQRVPEEWGIIPVNPAAAEEMWRE